MNPPAYRSFPMIMLMSIVLSATMVMSAEIVLTVDTVNDDVSAMACDDGVADDCSLRGAVTAANKVALADTVLIQVPAGSYELTINGAGEDGNLTGDLDVLRSMTIVGTLVGSIVMTTVDGGGGTLDDRLLEVHGAGTLLTAEHLNLIGADPPDDLHAVTVGPGAAIRFSRVDINTSGSNITGGGGLLVDEGASASLDRCKVWFNAGLMGGGILVRDGSLLVTDSEIRNNVGGVLGAGIAILDSAVAGADVVTIEGSYLYNNISADGGGIWAGTESEVHLTDTLLENNQVTIGPSRKGGGIFSRGEVTLDGCTITGGSANLGPAIYMEDAGQDPRLDMVNSTVSGVTGDPGVAAIYTTGASLELLYVTMADNTLDVSASMSTMQVTGSLFEAGCLPVIGTIVTTGGHNIGLDSSCWNGAPGPGDLVVADLLLEPLAMVGGPTPVHLPQEASLAVDHVAAGPCLPDDQRRLGRPATGCDSGSVERTPLTIFADGFESADVSMWSTSAP